MLGKTFKFIIALLFVPFAVSASHAFWQQLLSIKRVTGGQRYLLYGAIAYVICFIFSYRFERVYVFTHELTHSIAVWLFGGRVKSFVVKKDSGSITADKSNIFIALSPYVIPLNTIFAAVLYFLAAIFYDSRLLFEIFMLIIGASFAMHVILTIERARISQTDFFHLGHLGSVIFIYAVNLILIAFVFSLIFGNIHFSVFFKDFLSRTGAIYLKIAKQLFL
jgi:hypothetical protein